jgi:hypothetical protein
MAEDLRGRGLLAEAAHFVLAAVPYLQAARALQNLNDLNDPGLRRGKSTRGGS